MCLDAPPPSEVLVLLGRSLLLCWAAGAAPGTSTANLAVPSFAFLFLLAQVLGKAVNSNTISDCARGRELALVLVLVLALVLVMVLVLICLILIPQEALREGF